MPLQLSHLRNYVPRMTPSVLKRHISGRAHEQDESSLDQQVRKGLKQGSHESWNSGMSWNLHKSIPDMENQGVYHFAGKDSKYQGVLLIASMSVWYIYFHNWGPPVFNICEPRNGALGWIVTGIMYSGLYRMSWKESPEKILKCYIVGTWGLTASVAASDTLICATLLLLDWHGLVLTTTPTEHTTLDETWWPQGGSIHKST